MKKTFVVLFASLTLYVKAQDSTHFQRLLSTFTNAYYFADQKSIPEKYFESMMYASRLLQPYYEEFRLAKKEIKSKYSAKDDVWLLQKLSDSILQTFTEQYFWKGYETILAKYQKAYQITTDKSCPCYSQSITNKPLPEVIKSCDEQAMKDPVFITRLQINTAGLSLAEKMEAQKYVPRYIYQHCTVLHNYVNSILRDDIYNNYFSHWQQLSITIDEQVAYYFKNNKIDSLKDIFPAYAQSITDIKQALPFYTGDLISPINFKKEGETKTMIKTFIRNDSILGRVIYRMQVSDDVAFLTGFTYVESDKIPIKEREKILKELKEIPPPPPMENIKN